MMTVLAWSALMMPRVEAADIPMEPAPVWSVSVGAGNATPVLMGRCVVVTAGRGEVHCLERETGEVLWTTHHDVVSAQPSAAQPGLRRALEEADVAQVRYDSLLAERASLLRAQRRGEVDAADRLASLETERSTLALTLEAMEPFRPSFSTPELAAATPTPVVHDGVVYVAFGTGVVAAVREDGEILWRTWLGSSRGAQRGYSGGNTASPVVADDVLVVPYDHLVALDLASGDVRWHGPRYLDYGTPTVVGPPDAAAIWTPDGRLVSVATGAVVAEGLGDIYYAGPTARSSDAFLVGGRSDKTTLRPNAATRISWMGKETAGHHWTVELPLPDRMYGGVSLVAPWGVVVSAKQHAVWFDLESGTLGGQRTLGSDGKTVMAQPVVGDNGLLVTTDGDLILHLEREPPFVVVQRLSVPTGLARPLLYDGWMVVRSADAVTAYRSSP